LFGKPVGKKLLGKLTCGWKDNIKIDLREMGWEILAADGRPMAG
jgi:hypothetical protein